MENHFSGFHGQHELHFTAAQGFLVFGHGFLQNLRRVRTFHRQADALEILLQAGCQAFLADAHAFAEPGGQDDAHGHGFPVGDVIGPLTGFVFDGVAEGMAQVQLGALPFLERVP